MKKNILIVFLALFFISLVANAQGEAELNISVNNSIYSYVKNSQEKIEFLLTLKNVRKVKSWTLLILDSKGKVVKTLSGENSLPKKVLWDAKDENNIYVKDGVYSYRFTVRTDKEVFALAKDNVITVDSTSPFIFIKAASDIYFIEDNGKLDKDLNIYINCDDDNGIDYNKSGILIVNSRNMGVKQFKFENKIPELITWDGMDAIYGSIVRPGNYTVKCVIYDKAGNFEQTETMISFIKMPEDEAAIKEKVKKIEVKNEKRGAVITLSTKDLFGFDETKLKPVATIILNQVVDIIKEKYPKDIVYIEGHADSGVGREYDLHLSEKRAQAVYDFFAANGISRSRISTKGYGSTVPVSMKRSELTMEQNRRIEIVLSKEALD